MLKTESSLKQMGMESCARNYRDQLLKAQKIAVEIARVRGTVTSDDVREEAERRGLCLSFCKNWVGSIFRGRGWVKDGFTTSRHQAGHGRVIAVWKLTAYEKPVTSVPVQKTEPEKKPVFASELFALPQHTAYEFLP